MSAVSPTDRQKNWAMRGAELRLREIDQERNEILAAFPELRGTVKTRTMSPEARKRMSEGMRRHWQKRKAKGRSASKAQPSKGA